MEIGLRHLQDVGMQHIQNRVRCLTGWLIGELLELRHASGRPMVRLYGPASTEQRGATVTMNFYDPAGHLLDYRRLEELAGAQGISLRTGCFCNPGAGETAEDLSEADMQAGLAEVGDEISLARFVRVMQQRGGKSAGALRVSFGLASNLADAQRFMRFAAGLRDETALTLGPVSFDIEVAASCATGPDRRSCRAFARPAHHPLSVLAGGHTRTAVRQLRRAVALVHQRSARLLVVDLGLLRHPVADALAHGARGAGDARCHVVPGAQVNYAQQVLRHADAAHAAGHPAIVFQDETMGAPQEMSWPELRRQAGVFATRLREAGVVPGDRVCAYMPNTPQTVVAFLATASLGALWSVCSPDMGPVAVLDRFRQIEPKVLLAVDGQAWGGTLHDRRAVLRELVAGLPSLRHLVLQAVVDPTAAAVSAGTVEQHTLADWTAGDSGVYGRDWSPVWLPFDHPLWIVYSSGTTGLPKPIVHGHGGIILELLKGALHNDIHPSVDTGERFHWFSSTGWIMWNAQVGALLGGTTICIFDGNPGGSLASQGKAPRLGHAVALCCGVESDLVRRRRGVLRQLPEGRRRTAAAG